MAKYKMDMSGEKGPGQLLDVGWHDFLIKDVKEATSKGGNEMFIITVKEAATGAEQDVYAVATAGKRWFLKMFLTAMSIPAGADGVYEWDTKDVIGLYISGRIEHNEETWIDREGKTRISKKGKIVEWRGSEVPNQALGEAGPF